MAASRTVFLDTALSNYQSLAAQYGAGSYEVVLLDAGSPHAGQIQNWLSSHQLSAADATIVSASDSANGFFTPRVVFVDSSVANVDQLIAGMPANATVVVLDSGRDGVQQIHDYLAANAGKVGAVDIVSHGAPGELMLGSTVLNAANLASYGSRLADIGSHMTADADLLLYGCDVASGTAGQEFIAALAAATGADVAASTDPTGAAAAGGDWVLEASTGAIEAAALNIADYQNLLAQTIGDIKILPDTGSDPADLITKDTVQTVTFSVVGDNSAIWVSIDGGTRTQATLVSKTGGKDNYSVQVNTVSTEGKHTIQFWEKSTGTGQITTKDYTLDKTPPVAGTLSFNELGDSGIIGDGITNDNTFSLALSGNEAGSTVRYEYALNGSATFASTTAAQNGLADGSYQFRARVTDVAGNEAVTNTIGVTIVTTKPGAPSITGFADNSGSSSDTTTNDNTPTFTIKGMADAKVEVFEGGVSLGIATQTAAHSGVYTLTTPKLADGNHSFTAFVTDAAGNTSLASPAQEVIVDTTLTAPTVALAKDSGRDGGDGVTNDASLSFNKADGDATRVITVDGTKVGVYDPKALGDGKHTVTVSDTDVAGNTGSASITFILDTTAPSAGTLGFSGLSDSGTAGDGITNDRDFTLALTGNEAGSTVAYEVSVDGGTFHGTGADQAKLADGNYQFRAIVTDAAGNSATTAAVGIKIDATAPGAPSITAFSDNSGSKGDTITNDNTPTLTITAEADSTVQVFRGGVLAGTATQTAPGSGIYSFTSEALADGSHDFSAKATDVAGNTSAASSVQNVTVDTTPPAPSVALAKDSGTSNTDKLTNDASLNFGTLEDGASRVIKVDGTEVSSYNAAALKDGEHTVSVIDTDVAGNSGSASITFTLDSTLTAPTAVLAKDSGKDGTDGLTNDASLTVNKADSDATRIITVDGAKVDGYDPHALADGKHTVIVTDTDAAGNTATASVVFTLDTTAPTPSVALSKDSGASGTDKLSNDASLNFGSLEAGASRVITVDGTKVDVYDAATLKDGQHTVNVADTDVAGNTGSASITFTLDRQGPVFSSAATASVAENIGERQVVYRAAASDDHGVSYSLGGVDAAKFEIAADGSVTLKENPNYEVKDAYAFTVVATDGAGNHTDHPVALGISNVNEAPVATSIAAWTIETAAIGVQIANYVSDPDAGDKLSVSLASSTATLSWANTDAKMSTSLVNPVTHATVDLGTLTVKASIGADGQLTLTPPAELDWLSDGQFVKASFSYTVTDAGGLSSSESISLLIKGSTNDTGVNLSGGNGDDVLSGNGTNNAADVLMGNNGNDTLYGYGGTDALYGGNGDDKLFGGAGIDYLYGDNGNDTLDGGSEGDYLFGGKGNDILIGGSGADKFVFAPQNGNDRITDFNAAEGDMLYFADFFTTPPTVDAFLSKYVTDTGSDLLINLTGTTIVLVGVPNISDLKGHIAFGNPA